jgi:hypothetical protein
MQAAAAAAVVVVVVVVVVQLHTLSGVCAKPRWMALQASNKYDATNVEGWNGRRVLSLAWSAVPSAANSAGSAIEVAHVRNLTGHVGCTRNAYILSHVCLRNVVDCHASLCNPISSARARDRVTNETHSILAATLLARAAAFSDTNSSFSATIV